MVLLAVVLLLRPILYRINPFNRIYGNITITQDGKAIELSKDDIKASYDFNSKSNDSNLYLSTKGNAYGVYTYSINIDDVTLDFDILHLNEWDVMSFNGNIDINTTGSTPTVDYSIDYTSLNENYNKVEYNTSSSRSIQDNSIKISIGG
jgi:hypothetical protein